MIDSEFDECFFESAEEQRKFKKRVSDAIAEMPMEPDQFSEDWRAQLDLENKLYEELVAECPREKSKKALEKSLKRARLAREEWARQKKAKMELMNRPLDSPEFDNTQFVSLAEQQDYEQQVKQAIAEMPIDPEQCAQDMAAICEIQLKIYDQVVAKREAE